ncbi:MAG: hypothetical protein ABSG43_00285 [Solirubrobacteraceae bacterium]
MPVEVELSRKSDARRKAIMSHYRRWISSGHATGLMYVVDSDAMADRVARAGAAAGVRMRVERLSVIVEQARAGRAAAAA